MQHVDLGATRYIGADIVTEIVNQNAAKFSGHNREFRRLDVIEDALPMVDLVFCRDLFIHLSFRDISKALQNIKRSNSKYLLTNTFDLVKENADIRTSGSSRVVNLRLPPFSLRPPVSVIREDCDVLGRNLSLWRIDKI
jgi:hypothetical protein